MSKNQAATAATSDDKLSFRKWRRRVVEQIMSRKDLPPIARLTAWSIAERLHEMTRSTPSSSMTLGRAVGITPNEAQAGLDALVAAGQAQIKYRENGTRDIRLLLRDDIQERDTPVLAESAFFKTSAYPAFLSVRAIFITKLFADRDVSSTDKVIAFAATRFIEVESGTIDHTFRAMGAVVGYGSEAVRKSVGRLVTAGYFSKDRSPGGKAVLTPAMDSGMWSSTGPGTDSGMDSDTAKSRSDDFTDAFSPIPSTSGDSGNSLSPFQEKNIAGFEPVSWGKRTKTLDAACGQWRHILVEFGIPHGALDGKHHPCPSCGGKDRFRFTDRSRDGDYYCSGCGPGKGINLVAKVNGWDYAEAAKQVDELIDNEAGKAA
jgi:hypothetical protein